MRPGERKAARLRMTLMFLLVLLSPLRPEWLRAAEESGRYIDEELQMGLADEFFKEGDYYRAVTEYKRFLFFFPQSSRVEEVLSRIAKSYFNGKKWDETVSLCDEWLKKFPASPRANEAYLLKGLALSEKKELSPARFLFRRAQESSPGTALAEEAQFQIARTYVKEEEWREAAEEFRKIDRTAKLYPKGEYWAKGLDRMDRVPHKSPTAAGVLAAVLPGAGHVYTERYRDAAIAFLLNGAFIWAMIESFQHNNNVVGGILTFFELGWYSGNIYSAVASAHKYNKKEREQYLDELEKGSDLAVGISFRGETPVLYLRYVF
jgi:tetratricopeptide (TPR) repeat protein